MTAPSRATAARVAPPRAARAAVVALALALAACATGQAPPDERRPDTGAAPDHGPVRATSPDATAGRALDVPVRPARDAPARPEPAPVQVDVPSLDVSVPVVAMGVDDAGRMALPDSADDAGWYRFGSAPTSPAGATVIAAHVDDSDSVGPFAELVQAPVGTRVQIRTEDGTRHDYTVSEVRSMAKSEVSPDALFDRAGEPRLVLVTCGGAWDPDARSYKDNVVVTAVPERP